MPQLFEEKHLLTIDKLLDLQINGSWYFRREMEEFMDAAQIVDVCMRLEQIYEKGVVKNMGRPYNPKYKFHHTLGMDTQASKIVLQVILPSSPIHAPELAGELVLNMAFEPHGAIRLSVPAEAPAEKLARENGWKASPVELEALNTLIEAAHALQSLGSKHFLIELHVGRAGVQVLTRYYNPADQVRAALAKA
jgi:hypothetical protein